MTTHDENPNDSSDEDSNAGAAAFVGGVAAPKPPTLREAAASVSASPSFREAYLRLKPIYDQMPADKLPPVTLDVADVVVMGLGVLAEVEKLRAEIHYQFTRLPEDLIDQVRGAAHGLAHANTLKSLATIGGRRAATKALVQPVRVMRDHLVGDVNPLVVRGIVPPQAIALSRGNSPRNVAFDVLKLVEVADINFHHLEGQSKTTRADLQAAATAAQKLIEYLGAKEQSAESAAENALTLRRALAYFMELYEELRWAVRYVRRRHKDANVIIPSLYTLRKKRGPRAPDDDDDAATPTDATRPAPSSEGDLGIDIARLQAIMAGGVLGKAPTNSPYSPNVGDTDGTSEGNGAHGSMG